jgi:hypothetical protein
MADGTSYQVDIAANASGVVSAADGLDRLDAALERATASSKIAADALKAGEASYSDAESAADRAAKAVERIGVAVEAQRGKLAKALETGDASSVEKATAKLDKMLASQAKAQSAADAAKASLDAEAAALDKLKSAATQASDEEERLGKEIDKASKAAGTGKANEAAEGLAKLGGPLGSLGQKAFGVAEGWNKLKGTFGDKAPLIAGAVGVAAIAAALVAVGVAAVVGVAHFAAWALAASSAARTQDLLAQGVTQSVEGGHQLAAAIGDLSKRVPLTSDELLGMSKNLAASGLKGQALTDALEKTAEEAARLKFGPDFAKEMLSIDRQTAKLKSNFTNLFSGLKLERLLEAFSKLVDLFDSSNASGNAIKVLFESLFQPLVDAGADIIPTLVAAFIGFEIRVMRTMLGLKLATKEYGPELRLIGEIASVAFSALYDSASFSLSVLWELGTVVFSAVVAVMRLGQAAYDAGAAIVSGIAYGIGFAEAKIASFTGIGSAMVDGIASGISNGATKVIDAITGVADGAVSAAKKALRINSPSKVFHAEVGEGIGEGIAGGVEESSSGISDSIEAATSPTNVNVQSAAPSGGASSTTGARSGVSLENVSFIFNGVKDAEGARGSFVDTLLSVLEGDLDSLGEGATSG